MMICNKKAYPDLKKDCETCSERDACFSGHAVGVALAEIPKLPNGGICKSTMQCNSAECVESILVPHDYRVIKVADGMTITIDVEELKEQMKRDIYMKAGLGLQYGA